jgi:CO dehydrogenase maturation factor
MIKIIATGKGGAGKTTVIASLSRLLADQGSRVLAVDTDPSMNLAMSLGIPFSTIKMLAEDKGSIRDRLIMDDPDDDGVHEHHEDADIDGIMKKYEVLAQNGVRVLVMGTIPYGGAGCICSSVSLVKLLIEQISARTDRHDYIIVDSQAGSEILGRGFAVDYDYNLVITEAFPKSMAVAKHVMQLANDLNIKKQVVIVNKVKDRYEIDLVSSDLCLNGDAVYPIKYDERVAEADRMGKLIFDYAPDSAVIEDIRRIMEMIKESDNC